MDGDVLRWEAVMPFSLEHKQKEKSYFGLQSGTLNLSFRCNLAVKKGFLFFFFLDSGLILFLQN